jgi:hypothetical protein
MYFVVHSPTPELAAHQEDDITILAGEGLAKLVVSSGLTNWLIRKTA